MNKFVSNGLNIQYIVKFYDSEVIAITAREQNLYKINFVNVQETEVVNLVQSQMGHGALELFTTALAIKM